MNLKTLAAGAAMALMSSTTAQAAVEIFTWESGTNVLASFSGSLDLSGLSSPFRDPLGSAVNPSGGFIGFNGIDRTGTSSDVYYSSITGVSGTAGTGSILTASSSSGDPFAVSEQALGFGVPTGYTSGTPISGSMTFANQTLAAMGLTTGTVTYTLPNDTITWTIGTAPAPAVIPLPAGLPLALAGLGTLAWLRRRKA